MAFSQLAMAEKQWDSDIKKSFKALKAEQKELKSYNPDLKMATSGSELSEAIRAAKGEPKWQSLD